MLDAADDAGVDSLLPVLVVLVAELPGGGKSKLKKYLIGRIERIENKCYSLLGVSPTEDKFMPSCKKSQSCNMYQI